VGQALSPVHRALGEYKVNECESPLKIRVGAATGVVQRDGAETGIELLARAGRRVYAVGKPA